MSEDLKERLHGAVGDITPTAVDVDAAWVRGRRRRQLRRAGTAAGALGLMVVAGVFAGSLTRSSTNDVAGQPVVDPRGFVAPVADGWVRLDAGRRHQLGSVDEAIDDATEIEEIVVLNGAARWPWRPVWDVAADGTIRWLDAESHAVHQRRPDGTVTAGERLDGLYDDGEFAVATALQIGPDGRTYITGPSFEADGIGQGQTQVMIVDTDGALQSLRANDPGLLAGMLFADGYGWQLHDPDANRWQPIVKMGDPQVLTGPEQRGREHRGALAPDGLALQYGDRAEDTRYSLRTPHGEYVWDLEMPTALNGWAGPAADRNAGQRLLILDAEGQGTADSFVLRFDPAGHVDAVRVDHDVAPGLEGIPDATAILGDDGYLYWPETLPTGDMVIVRYDHRVTRPGN